MIKQRQKETVSPKKKSFANIETRVFVTVVIVLAVVLVACGTFSYFVPQGTFQRDEAGVILTDTYVQGEVSGIAIWRVITAPVRVFASEDAVTIIMISLFLLIMSGVFNLLEKTGGIRVFIERIIRRLRNRTGTVVCVTVLVFMLFGSFFGMFEELVTLLPIITLMMISIGLDTMMGVGACLLAACFGFSAAITNPFSVGLAAEVADYPMSSGVWLRIVFFVITYLILCVFLMLHLRRIRKDPTRSLSFATDEEKRAALSSESAVPAANEDKMFRVYAAFFLFQALVLILIASVRAISGLAIPILAVSFLFGGIICGCLVCEQKRQMVSYILRGALSMLPAVFIIAMASSAKLIMAESGIMDTIMHRMITLLDGKNPFVAILLVYLLILFLQTFIGSASAKILLVMPIVMPVTTALGLSPALVILAYCMADGFTDVILPTNPVLLIGLSMANVSYGKWVRWTWKLQVIVFLVTIGVLFFGVAIGY